MAGVEVQNVNSAIILPVLESPQCHLLVCDPEKVTQLLYKMKMMRMIKRKMVVVLVTMVVVVLVMLVVVMMVMMMMMIVTT